MSSSVSGEPLWAPFRPHRLIIAIALALAQAALTNGVFADVSSVMNGGIILGSL